MMPARPEALPPLRHDLAARAEAAVRGGGTWSLRHLRNPWIVVSGVGVPAVVLAWATAGAASATAVLVAILVVGSFFTVSAWAVARAGEIDPRHTMPAALLTYGLKLVLLGLLFAVYPTRTVVDQRWLGGAVAVGALLWIGTHAVTVWRTPMMYVDLSSSAKSSDQDKHASPRAVFR